jgi:hypothetical protein
MSVKDALFGPETARRLVFVQAGLAALIGLRVVLGPYRQLATQPSALFVPVPILEPLERMPSVAVFAALQVIGGIAAALAVARRYPRAAFVTAWLCYLALTAFRGSRGKVLHNDLLLLWAAAPFLFAPRAEVDDRVPRRRWGWPVRSSMVIVALIYFFAGVWKLRRSGVGWAFGDNMRYILLWGPSAGQDRWDALAEWIWSNGVAYRAAATSLLAFELTFPLAVVLPRLRVVYALLAAALHTGTYLMLGLDYWAWAGTVAVLFIDWSRVVDWSRGRRADRKRLRGRRADRKRQGTMRGVAGVARYDGLP